MGALIIFLISQPAVAAPPRFGIWVEAEGENKPFVSRGSLDGLKHFLKEGQFSDVYAQVYRGGRAWFPSAHADAGPFREAKAKGIDPLREIIDQAHREGRRVHAWINVLRVESADVPIVQLVGREGVLRDSVGNSLLLYSREGIPPGELGKSWRLDTPGIWLDPAVEPVRRQVLVTIRDLIDAYPDLDGIHLDMIRFPFGMSNGTGHFSSFELGYSAASVAGFYKSRELTHVAALVNRNHDTNCPAQEQECGGGIGGGPSFAAASPPTGEEWDEWRRLQITLLVFEIRELLSHVAPQMELSAAVLASQDRAHDHAYQDWSSWLRGGLVDTVIPMAYTADTSTFAKLSREAGQVSPQGKTMMGIGAWLLLREQSILLEQVEIALKQRTQGVVLFSFSNLVNDRGRQLVARARALLSADKGTPPKK